MVAFVVRRALFFLPTLLLVSMLAFFVMQLQVGDYTTRFAFGASPAMIQALKERYGLDQPPWVQYWRWISGIVTRGDFGFSFETQQPATQALFFSGDKLKWTLIVAGATMLFTWLVAIPIGIYSATHKYSLGDHVFTTLGFVGLSIPNFFLSLLILWFLVVVLKVGPRWGLTIGGILDAAYVKMSWWQLEKWLNFLWHLWPAVLVIGTANMAQLIRYMRGSLLDVLGQPYVQSARAKGLTERVVVWKHAVRNAINPLISMLGFWIPYLFEGTLVAAVVLGLPMVEKGYWDAITVEDQYVVMSGLLFFGTMLFIGNLIADVLLLLADPKIRYD